MEGCFACDVVAGSEEKPLGAFGCVEIPREEQVIGILLLG